MDPRDSVGRKEGCGLMVSVLVLMVVLTDTTDCFLPFRSPLSSSEPDSSSESSGSAVPAEPSVPTSEGAGDADISVSTDVLYEAIAF